MKQIHKKGLSLERGKATKQKIKKASHNKPKAKAKDSFSVTFLGVRGTIPTPAKEFLRYGGHTSCIEITSVSNGIATNILFDAGTGIINYGDNALNQGIRIFHLFLSHMHYDHIIGLTRFAPLFRDDCEIHIYGQSKLGHSLQKIIQDFFITPFFPIEFSELPSIKNLHFYELNSLKSIDVNHVRIDIQSLNHPQDALAYRIWNVDKTSSIIYATDHEHGSTKDAELKKFIQNSTLFIYDSTYTNSEYKNYMGWGHSTAKFGAQLAKECGVKNYAIFHHDPSHNDKYLEENVLTEAKKIFKNSFLAKENLTLKLK